MGDLREPNGAVLEDSPVPSSSSSSSFAPEVWVRAELATQKIIRQVQPTVASEDSRRDVIDYVQRLLRTYLGCEVILFLFIFPYYILCFSVTVFDGLLFLIVL